jgi:hypothetical protein
MDNNKYIAFLKRNTNFAVAMGADRATIENNIARLEAAAKVPTWGRYSFTG